MLIDKPKIEKILVIVDESEFEQSETNTFAALRRAVSIANATGAKIELFHVCCDPTFTQKIFAVDAGLTKKKEQITARLATSLAEMTLGVDTSGVEISREVRWDYPIVDALLRKIEDYEPDLVIRHAHDHDYLLGLMSNVDWELIRRSPAPLWFVRDEIERIENILTAVGTLATDDDIISTADYNVFRFATALADAVGARTHAVHSYEVPAGLPNFSMYGPIIGGATIYPADQDRTEEARRAIAQEHGEQIQAFAEFFNIDAKNIHLVQGPPSDVLPAAAQSIDADVVVMGARNLDRWQRILGKVTAEPVLARSECDVVFLKPRPKSKIPVTDEQPVTGTPLLDVEAAITHPERVFDSPAEVAEFDELSPRLRERILLAWDQDVRAQIREEEEGGRTKSIDLELLGRIQSAMESIRNQSATNS